MIHHILRSKRNSNVITRDLSFSLLRVLGPLTFLFVVILSTKERANEMAQIPLFCFQFLLTHSQRLQAMK